jgi:hypothetical protein
MNFNFNKLTRRFVSVGLLAGLTTAQVVQQIPNVQVTQNQAEGETQISLDWESQIAEAANASKVTSSQAKNIIRQIDTKFNEHYVQARRRGNFQTNMVGDPRKDELGFAVGNWKNFLHAVANYTSYDKNLTNARIVRARVMELYRSQVRGHILQGARAYNPNLANLYVSIWDRYTSIDAFSSAAFGWGQPSKAQLQAADGIYPLILKLERDYLKLQYQEQLEEIAKRERGGAESLYYLESYLTSLHQNIEAKGQFRMDNIGPIGAVGSDLAIPQLNFEVPLVNFLPNNWQYQERLNKSLNKTRHYYLLKLAVRVSKAMNRLDARGVKVEHSIRKMAGEFVPLLIDIGLDASDIGTVKKTASGGSAADDLARKADDLDDTARGRNNSSNPCVASASTGFIAVATDTPTMEFSSGAIVASAGGLGGGEMLVASSGCKITLDEFNSYESPFDGSRKDPRGNPVKPVDAETILGWGRGKGIFKKTNFKHDGKAIYEARIDIKGTPIKKGNLYYLDNLHGGFIPEIEVFDKTGRKHQGTMDIEGKKWTGTPVKSRRISK